jgi:hypothetical protein
MYSTVLHTTWRFNGANPRRRCSAPCCAALSGPGEGGGSLQQHNHAKPQMCAECGRADVSIRRRTVKLPSCSSLPFPVSRAGGSRRGGRKSQTVRLLPLTTGGIGFSPCHRQELLARGARQAHNAVRPAICQLSEEVWATLRMQTHIAHCYAPKLAARVRARDSALVRIGRAECPPTCRWGPRASRTARLFLVAVRTLRLLVQDLISGSDRQRSPAA